jgi:hypothetical protein
MWYNQAADKAANKSPNVGRIQHYLVVLARPNIVQQLFYYSKALVSVIPFSNARESVMLLFNPFLNGSEIAGQRYPVFLKTEVIEARAPRALEGEGNGIDASRGAV